MLQLYELEKWQNGILVIYTKLPYIARLCVSLVILGLYGLPHGRSLQRSTSEAGPTHFSPPHIAATVWFLLFALVPSPHLLEHLPKLHSPHSQSAM